MLSQPMKSSTALPHPVAVSQFDDRQWRAVVESRCPDPRWHFRLRLPWPMTVAPNAGLKAPAPGRPARLAWYRYPQPLADLQIAGHWLEGELDPLHWLEQYMKLAGLNVVSAAPGRTSAGLVGDMVATWTRHHQRYAGRFLAAKWGPRMFLLSLSAQLDDYPRLADSYFRSIASFEALDDSLGVFAEPARPLHFDVPVKWRALIPDSWWVQRSASRSQLAGVHAVWLRGRNLEAVNGKLSFGLAGRSVVATPRQAAELYLATLRAHGIEPEHDEFVEEDAEPPFERSWLHAGLCHRDSLVGEVRCRVMLHPRCWVVGGLVGPSREQSGVVWMVNKRALDVVYSTLRFGVNR